MQPVIAIMNSRSSNSSGRHVGTVVGLALAVALALGLVVGGAGCRGPGSVPRNARPVFADGARILFQGDSITDGNRGRSPDPNHILGHGYQFLIAAQYGARQAERGLVFMNRGISGNRVSDLARRWEKDTLELRPDLLSILIGVNDLGSGVPADEYERQYDRLLAETVAALPGVRLVLCEPFGLPVGPKRDPWATYRAQLEERQAIVRRLAEKYGATLVCFQRMFEAAARRAPAEYWIWDGVHPTYSGHQLMAEEWIRAVESSSTERK